MAIERLDRRPVVLALCAAALAVLASLVVTPVPADRTALVLRLGLPVRAINAWRAGGDDAGLALRWPIAERVVWLDRRLMTVAIESTRVTTGDGQPLVVDSYATWRVTDPVRFYQALGDLDHSGHDHAAEQLRNILASVVREQLGHITMGDVAALQRGQGTVRIRDAFDRALAVYGAHVTGFGVSRLGLPDGAPLDAAYARMSVAADSAGQDITAQSHRNARLIRADAEARAVEIYAASFVKDPQFYDFYRAMQSYDAIFAQKGSRTTVVISPANAYLKQFHGQ
ncbi:SPFH domain-containing protein [Novosphingobium sp.]|uniref:SPFH domain-containing protein n=1 Tax=Novosphingobium sp. TaxID=1874826 RepID=UPI003D0EB8E2